VERISNILVRTLATNYKSKYNAANAGKPAPINSTTFLKSTT
jgi:hypothetical protein